MGVLDLVRPNILRLKPYRCARDDFSEGILLDANENTHGPAVHDLQQDETQLELNRYPDPHQIELKSKIAALRGPNLKPDNLYLGVGSDEAIDSMIRVFCVPGKDKLAICTPTYGMYSVCAEINDVGVVAVPLDLETFELRTKELIAALNADKSIKLLFLCSPGNPTGKLLKSEDVLTVLRSWNGVVVADEAYIDFTANVPSLAPLVTENDRLVVLQTLSKSFGLAGVRLGLAFAHKDLASVFNAMKAPYNVSALASSLGLRALQPKSIELMKKYVASINSEKERLSTELLKIPRVNRNRGGMDANFLLMEIVDEAGKPSNESALHTYNTLATARKVVVRFRGNEPGCTGCLRISIGTQAENDQLIKEISSLLS